MLDARYITAGKCPVASKFVSVFVSRSSFHRNTFPELAAKAFALIVQTTNVRFLSEAGRSQYGFVEGA